MYLNNRPRLVRVQRGYPEQGCGAQSKEVVGRSRYPKAELNFGRREQCPLGKPRPKAGKQAVNREAYWPWV